MVRLNAEDTEVAKDAEGLQEGKYGDVGVWEAVVHHDRCQFPHPHTSIPLCALCVSVVK